MKALIQRVREASVTINGQIHGSIGNGQALARVAHLDYSGAVDRFRAAHSLPVAERSADSMEMAIVDSRRRQVEERLKEALREDERR